MPIFEYTAINPVGKQVKGSIDSDTARAARQRLRSNGIYPTDIKEAKADTASSKIQDVKKFFKTDKISTKNLSVATRQLATLVGGGIPLVDSLQALSEQTENMDFKRIMIDVRERVEEGSALAKALGAFPKAFPRLFVNMVASGEASGTLDAVLENLADYLEASLELRRKITAALFYPILMLGFCILVVTGLLVFVVPAIVEIFEKQGAVLPFPTRFMIGISAVIINYWYLLIATVFASVYLLKWYYAQPQGRDKIDRLKFKVPLYGGLYRKICTARISRTLGTLINSGVGLLTALDIVKNIVPNVHVTRAIEEARDGVREGRSLARELARPGIFPSMLCQMIAVGEKSGELERMLDKAGKAYESEVNSSLAGLTSLIEPLMIIGLGGIVLSIVISILMPMVDLMNVVQR